MKLLLTITASTLAAYLIISIDPLIGGILALGIVSGILIRILVIVNDLHKVLIVKERKTALDRYLEERDSKENAVHFKA